MLGIRGRHGAFAERLALPVENLHAVPEPRLPTTSPSSRSPWRRRSRSSSRCRIGPTEHVVVIGDGKLGQLVAQTLALTGCELLVVGRHP